MNDNQPDKPRHIVATVAIVFVVFIALYLTGFVAASKLGPGLRPPVSTVLEFVYWPLLKCDQDNIEPFNTVIEWLRHGPPPLPGTGKTMTVPGAREAAGAGGKSIPP